MKKNSYYTKPAAEVIVLKSEGMIAASKEPGSVNNEVGSGSTDSGSGNGQWLAPKRTWCGVDFDDDQK